MRGWTFYQTKDLAMIPLMEGTPVYRDGMLSHVYYELKRLGRIEQTMCGDHYSHDKWVSYFESLKTAQILCLIENEILKPVGMSWVSNPRGVDGARTAQAGFCFFGGVNRARDLARLAIGYAFCDLKIDTLFGLQVIDNFAARNFSIRMGFTEIAILPDYHVIDGKLVAARVMMLRKEDFWAKFLAWKEAQDAVS